MSARLTSVLYWLAFAGLAVRGGFQPCLVRDPHLLPYPWEGVVGTVCLLGAVTFIIHRILSPGRVGRSWWRWAGAIAVAGLFALIEVVTIGTDLPGYMYVPPVYAVVTLALLMVGGLAALLRAGARHLRGSSQEC